MNGEVTITVKNDGVITKGDIMRDDLEKKIKKIEQKHPHKCATCGSSTCQTRNLSQDFITHGIKIESRESRVYVFRCTNYVKKPFSLGSSEKVDYYSQSPLNTGANILDSKVKTYVKRIS